MGENTSSLSPLSIAMLVPEALTQGQLRFHVLGSCFFLLLWLGILQFLNGTDCNDSIVDWIFSLMTRSLSCCLLTNHLSDLLS